MEGMPDVSSACGTAVRHDDFRLTDSYSAGAT
ncbi:hypothetical protein KIPE111705_06785 [Kibdelosporangium persicum]